ncbi:MAG: hypothetical protein SFX18_19650 [Pirellulales bacterium]|nr:hypothetical protein [Pirellulales bacterium]
MTRNILLAGGILVLLALAPVSALFAGQPLVRLETKLRSHVPQPPAAAQPVTPAPQYMLLQGAPGGNGQTVRATPYAYGWFGVGRRSHYEYSRGYYGQTNFWHAR